MPGKGSWFQNISFQWRGRTKEGVSKWWGAPKGPPEWFSRIFLTWGVIAGTAGLLALPISLITHNHDWYILTLVGMVHCAVFGLTGLWALRLRRNLMRLKSAEELAEEFGSDPETVRRLAEEHDIRPQININDVNLYDPQVFHASQVLLRAASAPITPDVLLRPAEPMTSQAIPETLLRAADPEMETPTSIQILPDDQTASSTPEELNPYSQSEEAETENIQQLHP